MGELQFRHPFSLPPPPPLPFRRRHHREATPFLPHSHRRTNLLLRHPLLSIPAEDEDVVNVSYDGPSIFDDDVDLFFEKHHIFDDLMSTNADCDYEIGTDSRRNHFKGGVNDGDEMEIAISHNYEPIRRINFFMLIGIIRRKALVKELAAVYHAECLTYCQELLELQKKLDEPFTDINASEEPKKEMIRPSKRMKSPPLGVATINLYLHLATVPLRIDSLTKGLNRDHF
ncbi:hypothetical protein OROGR_002956 [Orobanche gracilis]